MGSLPWVSAWDPDPSGNEEVQASGGRGEACLGVGPPWMPALHPPEQSSWPLRSDLPEARPLLSLLLRTPCVPALSPLLPGLPSSLCQL